MIASALLPFLERIQASTDIVSIEPGPAGGNNRLYRVETREGLFAFKQYFQDATPRAESECLFLEYAAETAPGWVPRLYAFDLEAGLSWSEWIDGQPIERLTPQEVSSAADFFIALNRYKDHPKAQQLPLAKEACFSIQEHLLCVHKRILALQGIIPQMEEDRAALALTQEIEDLAHQLMDGIWDSADLYELDLNAPLEPADRCISPSDFGFHNALKTADGTLRFIDFEYAGWDDPAKMVGDFFAQVAVPVPALYGSSFLTQISDAFQNPKILRLRAELLKPIYALKWCAIVLNIFLPQHLSRRAFAQADLSISHMKKIQLEKAKNILNHVGVSHVSN